MRTICDDTQLKVNTLAQDEHEKEEDYYVRKLNILRSLIHGRRCILVINDCVREEDWDLRQLLSVGWKVILITRSMDLADAYAQLRAGPIKDQADLHAPFAAYLREPLRRLSRKRISIRSSRSFTGIRWRLN